MKAVADGDKFYRVTAGDVVLTAVILALFVALLIPWTHGLTQAERVARIYEDGRLVRHIQLAADQVWRLRNGRMVVEVKAGRVCVAESDCPNKVCVRAGWISSPGQTIVCAPNRVLIEMADDRHPPDCDAISY